MFLHLISTRFPTFHKRKGGIFQVSKGEEKFSQKYFCGKFPLYTLFSSISYCSSFFSFIFGCYFSTACMYYRNNFQSFDLFVCVRAWCCVLYYSFLWFRIRIIWIHFNHIVPQEVILLFWYYIWCLLLSLSSTSIRLEFLGFLWTREVCVEIFLG